MLEKVQCVVLTDGEAPPLKYHKTVQRHWENEPYLGVRQVCNNNCILRDRKLGTTYSLNGNWYEVTDVLLTHLKINSRILTLLVFVSLKVVMLMVSLLATMVDGMMIMIASMLSGGKGTCTFTITNSGYLPTSLCLPLLWHRTTPLMSKRMQ